MTKYFVRHIVAPSTLDWDGKSVCTIFFEGCPLRCKYCHNHSLWEKTTQRTVENILAEIDRASPFIDGVVLSGGEPLFQRPEALMRWWKYGLDKTPFAVQTCGFYPERVMRAVFYGAEAIMLDVKAPLDERYEELTGREPSARRVKKTLNALASAGYKNLEVRTTVFEGIADTEEQIRSIVQELPEDCAYVLQRGRSGDTPVPVGEVYAPLLEDLAREARQYLKNVKIRN